MPALVIAVTALRSFAAARLSGSTWSGRGGHIRWLGRLSVRHIVVMFHDVRLLMTAVYADEYLVVQIKRMVGWLNIKRMVGWLNIKRTVG